MTELQSALELMHTASHRFHTIDAKLRQVHHPLRLEDLDEARGQGQWEAKRRSLQHFA